MHEVGKMTDLGQYNQNVKSPNMDIRVQIQLKLNEQSLLIMICALDPGSSNLITDHLELDLNTLQVLTNSNAATVMATILSQED